MSLSNLLTGAMKNYEIDYFLLCNGEKFTGTQAAKIYSVTDYAKKHILFVALRDRSEFLVKGGGWSFCCGGGTHF